MERRDYWVARVHAGWARRSVVWLTGVRRVGKTSLCHMLGGGAAGEVEVLDCERPRVRRLLDDPEAFLESRRGKTLALDEIHRLDAPSELLKLAADHHPDVRIVATGSSTLEASARFADTLTGRKVEVWMTPMLFTDLDAFGRTDLDHRMLHGGLPEHFLSPTVPEAELDEWFASYWARDIQELFRLEKRASFLRMFELCLARSGGIFEATALARPCEISRQSVMNYLGAFAATRVLHVVKPFSARTSNEIVAAPRVYGFDTGMVAAMRGWRELRDEDRGALWEHLVLNELHAAVASERIHHWRDKRGHEVDFVVTRRGAGPLAIECKWRERAFDPTGLRAFRKLHPDGENWVVASDVLEPHVREEGGLRVRYVPGRRVRPLLETPS